MLISICLKMLVLVIGVAILPVVALVSAISAVCKMAVFIFDMVFDTTFHYKYYKEV